MNKQRLEFPSLRKFAKGRHCYVQTPECVRLEQCSSLAHIRRGGVAGAGQKPHDALALPACDICNAIMDGDHPSIWNRQEIDSAILKGYVQWLNYLARQEIILVCL